MRSVFPVAFVCNEGLQNNHQGLVIQVPKLGKIHLPNAGETVYGRGSRLCAPWSLLGLQSLVRVVTWNVGMSQLVDYPWMSLSSQSDLPLAMPIPFIYCMGKTAGYGSASLQLTERVSEIAFFAWPGLVWTQARHFTCNFVGFLSS